MDGGQKPEVRREPSNGVVKVTRHLCPPSDGKLVRKLRLLLIIITILQMSYVYISELCVIVSNCEYGVYVVELSPPHSVSQHSKEGGGQGTEVGCQEIANNNLVDILANN